MVRGWICTGNGVYCGISVNTYGRGGMKNCGFLSMQQAFWMLFQLLNSDKYAAKDLFRPGLPKLHILLYCIDQLVSSRLPDLYQHFVMSING